MLLPPSPPRYHPDDNIHMALKCVHKLLWTIGIRINNLNATSAKTRQYCMEVQMILYDLTETAAFDKINVVDFRTLMTKAYRREPVEFASAWYTWNQAYANYTKYVESRKNE